MVLVGPELVTLFCFSLPCDLCYTLTNACHLTAEQSGSTAHPQANSGTANSPPDLASGAASFLRPHAVVLFVGLVAWLNGDGGVV